MRQVEILRLHHTKEQEAIYGVLSIDGEPRLLTLEKLWKNNQQNISCIPGGIYPSSRYSSQRFGETFVVLGVPARLGILFHTGNTTLDTKGCILVGTSFNPYADGILESKKAFDIFMDLLKDAKQFQLTII